MFCFHRYCGQKTSRVSFRCEPCSVPTAASTLPNTTSTASRSHKCTVPEFDADTTRLSNCCTMQRTLRQSNNFFFNATEVTDRRQVKPEMSKAVFVEHNPVAFNERRVLITTMCNLSLTAESKLKKRIENIKYINIQNAK